MANYEKTQYGKEGFQFGDNVCESGTITASAAVAVGTVLKRDSDKEWVPAEAADLVAGTGLGLAVAEVESGSSVPFDVAIGGKFNRNFIKVEGDPITDAQCDILRTQGIVALNINPID